MRIGIIAFLQYLGGGERLLTFAIKALIEKGHDVVIIGEQLPYERIEGLFGIRLPLLENINVKSVNFLELPLKSLVKLLTSYYNTLIHKLRELDVEAVFYYKPIDMLELAPFFSRQRVLCYLHSIPFTFKSRQKLYDILLKDCYEKFLLKRVDNFLVNSRYTYLMLSDTLKRNCTILSPPIIHSQWDYKPFSKKEDIVVSLGRFDPDKKYEDVCVVAKMFPQINFYICGSTPHFTNNEYYNYINRIRPPNVHLKKDISYGQIRSLLSRAKLILHPAVNEPFGIAVLEGMASGCVPIVRKGTGAYYDILDRGKYGLSYSNISDLVKIMNNILADEGAGRRLSELAYERSRDFSYEQFAEKLVRIFLKKVL